MTQESAPGWRIKASDNNDPTFERHFAATFPNAEEALVAVAEVVFEKTVTTVAKLTDEQVKNLGMSPNQVKEITGIVRPS